MSVFNRYKADLLAVAGLLILPLLLFAQVTLGGRTMVPADNLVQWAPWAEVKDELGVEAPHNSLISDLLIENYAWKRFINTSLADGELPLWNPYIFAGAPFLATGQNAAYYPFSILFLVLPLAKAYGWYTLSQLWLAGVCAYVLGRTLGQRRVGAVLTGLIYQGSGFMLVSAAVFPMIIGAAAWLPLLLACAEQIVRRSSTQEARGNTLPWVVLGALALGSQMLAGHVEITYYTLLIMAGYAAWRLVVIAGQLQRSRRAVVERGALPGEAAWRYYGRYLFRPAGWLLGMAAVGFMLGAIQTVPLYEVARVNFREGSVSLAEVRGWAFPARRIVTLAMPDFFGNPTHHGYLDVFTGQEVALTTNYYGGTNPNGAGTSDWGLKNYVEGGIYLGTLSLFLALLGAWSFRNPPAAVGRRIQILFFLVLALFSLAFIFGTPLYALLYYGLPGINQLHSPFRWVFPLSLSVAVLAGFGVDDLYRRGESERSGSRTLVSAMAIAAFAGGMTALVGLGLSRLWFAQIEPVLQAIFLNLAKAPEAFPHVRAFYSYQARNILIMGVMWLASGMVLWLSVRSLGRRLRWPLLALLVVGVDLFLIGRGFNAAADPALLAYEPEVLRWMSAQPGNWRFTTFTPNGDKPLNANVGWLFDLQDVRGYDSMIARQYTDYMAAIEPQNELLFNRVQPIMNWEALNSPLLDLLGVRYVVTSETIALPKLDLVWQGEGLSVYENLAVVPRAYTMPASATEIVPNALEAMRGRDPRRFVFVESEDWPAEREQPVSAEAAVLRPAEIVGYSNLEVTMAAEVSEQAWLLLNDSYFPGWRAMIRPVGAADEAEQETPVIRVNGNFRGVLLEAGAWEVRMRYSPLTFKLGGLASAMALVVIFFASLVWGWRRFYNPGAELTNTRSIAKNSLAPTFLNLLNRFIDFLFAAFYLRLLGPADAGSYATAIAIAGWFEIISNFGLNTLVIREVSREQGRASYYLLNTTVLRLGTTLVGSVPIFIYLLLVSTRGTPLGTETVAAILLLMVGMFFSGIGQSLTGLFYAYETAETPAAIATVTTILKVGFGVIVLLLGYGFVGLAGVSILVNLVTLGILALAAYQRIPLHGPWRVDWPAQRTMARASYPLMLNHLLANIFFFIDVPMMQQINGDEAVGWYNSAYKWVNAFNVIPSFFTFALFPVISRQITHNIADAQRTFRMSVKFMVLLALPLATFTTLLAPILIGVLGGAQFLPEGAWALQIVIWSIPVGWINSVTNYVLIALGQERVQVRAFLIGVMLNIVLNLLLLPTFSYIGAAVTTIVSEIVLLVVFNIYLRSRMSGIGWLGLMWRPVALTLVVAPAMAIGAQVHLLVGLLIGIVLYPAGLWALRVFGEEERRIMASILPSRLAQRLRFSANSR